MDKDSKEKGNKSEKSKKSFFSSILGILRDIIIAAIIVGIIMAVLYAYSGVWPPPVVIESQSMSHDPPGERDSLPPSQLGVIDGGDMVIVKKVTNKAEITSYVQGQKTGYQTYSSYGDVIIYKAPLDVRNDETPVIHRVVLWVEFNTTTNNSWDIPEMNIYNNAGSIPLKGYGYNGIDITIDLHNLLQKFHDSGKQPHSGYITMGDHNSPIYDQGSSICPEPIKFDWIVGVARGELPWFGGLKLWVSHDTYGVPENSWYYLITSIVIIILAPIILDYLIDLFRKKRNISNKGTEKDKPPLEKNNDDNIRKTKKNSKNSHDDDGIINDEKNIEQPNKNED